MPNPTQPARYFQGLPTAKNFSRDYETQQNVPIDGSSPFPRALSPFVIRPLLPTILGESNDRLTTTVRPRALSARAGDEVIESLADGTNYSDALRNSRRADPSRTTYAQLVNLGQAIPGLTESNVVDLDREITNFAVNEAAAGNLPNRRGEGSTPNRVVPAITNDITGLSVLNQLRKILDVPPLILLINPTTFSVSYNKIAQFSERSRYGYIYQAWGEELTKVSFSCTIGAFTSGKASSSQTNVPSGVQFASKNDSAAFQQLMAMMSFFQSGAYITDTVQNSLANQMIGNLAIEYDQNVYVGHIDSFSYSFEEEKQNGGLQFDIDFTAIKVYDQAQPVSVVSRLQNPNTGLFSPRTSQAPPNRLSRTFLSGTEGSVFTEATVATPEPSIANPWRSQPQPTQDTVNSAVVQILSPSGGLAPAIPGTDFTYDVSSSRFTESQILAAASEIQSTPGLRATPEQAIQTVQVEIASIITRRT